jgi:hypothetical protein
MEKPATLGRAGPPPDTGRRADDATLIARSRAEPEAFAAIFDRHATDIHRYAARRLGPGPAEDVVGETFLVVPPADTGNPVSWVSLNPLGCPGAAPARGTYAFLASLPTDPARLRAWIYQHPDGQNQADTQAWTDIGDMLREMLVPPKLAAALYRVAATIPGATVVPRAKNAVGRTGVAVSRSGAALVFDPKTYQLIGEGAVLTKAVSGQGPAGTVIASTAQLKESVVSHLPDIPPSAVEKDAGGPSC